jgi:hypothetical protein
MILCVACRQQSVGRDYHPQAKGGEACFDFTPLAMA